jgi:methyl-accepting chemotaxis protein
MSGALRSLVPEFIRRSYVLKFGITLLVLGLTIGMIGFVATDQIQQRVEAGVDRDLADIAAQEATTFQTWHERNVELTASLAAGVTERTGGDDRSFYLTSRANALAGANSIHVVDLERDRLVASTDRRGQPLDRVGESWASALTGTDGFTGEPRVLGVAGSGTGGPAGSPPQLVYAAPVGSGDEVLVYTVRVNDYTSALTGGSAFVYVVTPDYRIVYDSTGRATFDDYPRGGGVADALIRASEERAQNNDSLYVPNVGRTITPSPDQESLALSAGAVNASGAAFIPSYANVRGTDYTVVVHTPQTQAMGFVQTVEQWGFVVTIVGVIMIALFGVFVGYNTAGAIDRLRLKSEEMERGNLDVDFETDRVDNIGRLYGSMANMRDALRNQIMEARNAREEAENARERAEQTNRHLQAKANEYRDVMQAVAAGDLGERMTPSERNQAMQGIAEEFNAMIDEIERTVAQLKAFADEVAQSSEEVTASAEEVRSASEEVTHSIQEISEGADRQNDSLQSVAGEMSDLSTTVEEIASLSNEVADLSEQTTRAGQRGREAAREAISGMNQIEDDSEDAVEAIERLAAEMEQIDELVEVIADLADQTNMIALNANIEASRADADAPSEESEGFAVVAQEVKDLAGETKRAAQSIEQRIQRIQTTTDETVASVKRTGERIAAETDSVRNAVEALDEIAEYAEDTNGGVQEISAATQQQAASTEEVVGMVDEAATISDRTSAEAQNVAAAAEEQTAAVSEVTDSASSLSEQASRLSDALGRFHTREVDQGLFEADGPGPDLGPSGETASTDRASTPETAGSDTDADTDPETDAGSRSVSGDTGGADVTEEFTFETDLGELDDEVDESTIPGGPLGSKGSEEDGEQTGDDD